MPSHPLSARKTREAARAAVTATNAQADALQRIAQQLDSKHEELLAGLRAHESALRNRFALFFGRGFFGRLKFLVLGR